MNKKALYTIGHGTRSSEDFLALLKGFEIEYLVDVRSLPYSKYNPQYNQNELRFFLERHGIKYIFMGDALGGRPKDKSCYALDGKVDYETIKTKDFFKNGIKRLKIAYKKDLNLALMCSESKPCECHRSKLIGSVFESDGIRMKHIDEKGNIKDQEAVMNESNKGLSEVNLFGDAINATSRKTYL